MCDERLQLNIFGGAIAVALTGGESRPWQIFRRAIASALAVTKISTTATVAVAAIATGKISALWRTSLAQYFPKGDRQSSGFGHHLWRNISGRRRRRLFAAGSHRQNLGHNSEGQ